VIGGTANIFTKVGNGTTVAIMLAGYANIFTHVGDGFMMLRIFVVQIIHHLLGKGDVFPKQGLRLRNLVGRW
jgi:hypothetical protein